MRKLAQSSVRTKCQLINPQRSLIKTGLGLLINSARRPLVSMLPDDLEGNRLPKTRPPILGFLPSAASPSPSPLASLATHLSRNNREGSPRRGLKEPLHFLSSLLTDLAGIFSSTLIFQAECLSPGENRSPLVRRRNTWEGITSTSLHAHALKDDNCRVGEDANLERVSAEDQRIIWGKL